MHTILISQITLEELQQLVTRCVLQANQMLKNADEEEKLLSIAEACHLFSPKISRQTLRKYTKRGLIPDQYIGKRPYYRKQDILNAVKRMKCFAHR